MSLQSMNRGSSKKKDLLIPIAFFISLIISILLIFNWTNSEWDKSKSGIQGTAIVADSFSDSLDDPNSYVYGTPLSPKEHCLAACRGHLIMQKYNVSNMSDEPCIDSNVLPGWTCVLVHTPLTEEDYTNMAQCLEEGTTSHVIEVDANCTYIGEA